MKLKPVKFYLTFLTLGWGIFFGTGLWDRQRLHADQAPFFASGPLATPQRDSFRGLHYEAALTYEVADFRDSPIDPPVLMRLPSHAQGGHLNFRWNYWTLAGVTALAFVIPHLFERIPGRPTGTSL